MSKHVIYIIMRYETIIARHADHAQFLIEHWIDELPNPDNGTLQRIASAPFNGHQDPVDPTAVRI